MKKPIPVCIALAALTAANSFARPLEPPAAAPSSKQAVVIDRVPTKMETYGSNIEGTSFGVFAAKGSLALGLLLGPLGVAANTAHINKENRAASGPLSDLTSTDLRALLRAAQASAVGAANGPPGDDHYELLPTALIRVPGDQATFSLRCVVHAYLMKNGKSTWHARFISIIDDTFQKDDAAAMARAKESLSPCFAEAYRLFAGHVDGGLRGGGAHKVRFDDGDAHKITLVESELPQHVVVADEAGLMEYPRGALGD